MSGATERIGRLARAALEQEARLTPKPGLVDAENSGSHTDMDLSLFLASAAALEPYFVRFAFLGARDALLPPEGRLSAIRADGVAAERAMFAATNGINTHKGAIFLLGVLCYCAGRAAKAGLAPDADAICSDAALVCRGVTGELGADAGRAYARYGAKGARGEAEGGYPNALAALTAFHTATASGAGEDDGWRAALLTLIAQVDDANVLARCGAEQAQTLRARARAIALQYPAGGPGLSDAMRELDRECRAAHASPGGSADLLACAMFLHALTSERVIIINDQV